LARKSDDGRWDYKFAQFVRDYGVEKLAARLDVRPAAVYHWISGKSSPREWRAIAILQIARRRKLSLKDIYRHSRAV
jgi:hypothetical protein